MINYALIAYAHYICFMILFAAVVAQHLLYHPAVQLAEVRRLRLLAIIFAASALATLLTGVLRMMIQGNGFSYYFSSQVFLFKLLLFTLVVLLALYPTRHFLRLQRSQQNPATGIAGITFRRVMLTLRLQLLALLLIPAFASFMASGY